MAVEKINQIIAQKQQYILWVDKPLANKCGCEKQHKTIRDHVRDYLKPLKTKRSNDEWEWLSRHVLVTLFCANQYSPKDDRLNRNTNERLKNLESELTCISKFNELIRKDFDFGVRFFLHACVPQNSPGKILFNIPHGQYDSVFKTAFRDYKASLKKEISTLRRYRKKMLVARGGLLYPQFKSDGKKAVIQDIEFGSKLFHLTFIFRHFTDRNRTPDLGIQPRTMPPFGRPHYDLTAKILDKDTDSVKKHVTLLVKKDVNIKPWPISL